MRNSVDVWTAASGWICDRRRRRVTATTSRDARSIPLLRKLAADTPGVELISGWTASALLGERPPAGVRDRGAARTSFATCTRGSSWRPTAATRSSRAGATFPGRVKPHGRFFYWGYWRGVRPATTRSKMWLLDPDAAYTFPNEDDLTVVLVAPHRDRLAEFQADLHGAYRRTVNSLPDGPDLGEARLESKLLGKLELPNVFRPAARPGLAFVGDAALAADPLWGVGCGWAFQSAEWLVQETAGALGGGAAALDAALERYRRVHRRRLLPALHDDRRLRQRAPDQRARAADVSRSRQRRRGAPDVRASRHPRTAAVEHPAPAPAGPHRTSALGATSRLSALPRPPL